MSQTVQVVLLTMYTWTTVVERLARNSPIQGEGFLEAPLPAQHNSQVGLGRVRGMLGVNSEIWQSHYDLSFRIRLVPHDA